MSRLEERQAEMRERIATEPKAFRSHSVSPQALRRVPSLILRSAEQRSAANQHVRKVFEGRKSPFALKPVPVSQAIEAMPEISGEINPVAVIESLAPEMFMGREVRRCRHCHLNQFMTGNGMCRKCRHSMIPEPQPVVDAQPVSEPLVFTGKIDIAFAVKLLRKANGLSQPDLARRLGCPRTWISKVENLKAVPTVRSIIRFAAALDATPYALISIAEAACAA